MADASRPFGSKPRPLAYIDPVCCTGCGYCALFCVMSCIEQRSDGLYEVDAARCIGCRSCMVNCFNHAVSMLPPEVRK